MIALDSSEFMRNGDFVLLRWNAQLTAMEYIFQNKVNSNPENTVGLLAFGGNGPAVLSTLTTDFGKILAGVHESKISGSSHFASGIQVAALALKHRQNKVQLQRIVVFIASPITESEKELELLAKKMKKNNVAIDVINFGEEGSNTAKLEKFMAIINNNDNSHLVTVLAGPHLLYEAVASSPILLDDGGFGGAGGFDGFGAGAGAGDMMDPSMDPDLALALRLSLEEEKARQEREVVATNLPSIQESKADEKDKDKDVKDQEMQDTKGKDLKDVDQEMKDAK